jgi:5,10-methylenetetrahydromethanopterin reductase
MEIGCLFPPTIETPDYIEAAEELGYAFSWVADSPTFMADPWITLGRAVDRTSHIRLGIAVITPVMRHVVSNAGAIATLSTLAPGRVDVVVGTGFTSQVMIGKKPARWADAERYITGLRTLLAGEELEWDGAITALVYGRAGIRLPAAVPILVAAHGPKGYATAARVGDGIVTNPTHGSQNVVWPHPRVLVQFNGTVLEEGESLESERVLDAAGPAAALHLHLGDEGAAPGSPEVAGYQESLRGIDERHRHLAMHRGHLMELTDLERPYITPELIRRGTDTGTPAEVRERLTGFAASGASGVLYLPAGKGIPRELAAFSRCAGL